MKSRICISRIGYFLSLILGLSFISCDIDIFTDSSDGNVANTAYSASAELSFDIEARASQTRLRLEAVNGSVEIMGLAGADSVQVWGERRVESESPADAAEHLQNLSVVVHESNDEVVVRTEQPRKTYGRNYVVDYHIRVPDTWRVFVEHINGNVTASSMNQSVDIDLVNGDVSIGSSNADVEVELTNGHMRLWDISGGVEGELTNGNIDGRIFLPISGSCRLKTVNGGINLEIPQSTSATLSAKVTNGTISLSDLSLRDQQVTSTTLTGKLGAGDGRIDLQAVNGHIVVAAF